VLALQIGNARVPLWDLAAQPFIAPAVEPRRAA